MNPVTVTVLPARPASLGVNFIPRTLWVYISPNANVSAATDCVIMKMTTAKITAQVRFMVISLKNQGTLKGGIDTNAPRGYRTLPEKAAPSGGPIRKRP